MVTIFIGISEVRTPSGSPVYAGGNGFSHAAFGRAADLNIFKGMLGLRLLALPTTSAESNWPLWVGGRGDVFYPRNDYFPATAYLRYALLVRGPWSGGGYGGYAFLHHTYRRVN